MEQVYEELFTQEPTPDGLPKGWMDGVTCQRVRTTHAGSLLMVDSYPVYTSAMMRIAREIAAARKDRQETREAQKKVNAAHARKKLAALAAENFGPGDILMTLTWRSDDQERPTTAMDAKKQMDKFIRKVRALHKARSLEPMRYIYVIESTHSKKHGAQHHVHLLTGGSGLSEGELRDLWRSMHRDARVMTDRVWDRPEGLTRWAGYVTKSSATESDGRQTVETARRWYASRGLKRPKVTVSDKKLSRTRADRIARDFDFDGKRILESIYKGYTVIDLSVRTSEWLPGAYIYAVMAEKEDSSALVYRRKYRRSTGDRRV